MSIINSANLHLLLLIEHLQLTYKSAGAVAIQHSYSLMLLTAVDRN